MGYASAADAGAAPQETPRPGDDYTAGEAKDPAITGASLPEHDPLTGLPGRRLFHNRIVEAIEIHRDQQQFFSLVMLDLDMIRRLNHTLGISIEDDLLREVARRLTNSLRSTDSVMRFDGDAPEASIFRLDGDEFGILLNGMEYTEFTAQIVNRIIASLTRRFDIGGQKIGLSCNIGISRYPENGRDADSLLKNAAIALYYAKRQGPNHYQFYDDELTSSSSATYTLQNELRHAVENNELELHYLPKIDLVSGRIVCMEALLRWRHPRLGMIPPGQFLPLAESSGLITAMGKWVLRTACRQLVNRSECGLSPTGTAKSSFSVLLTPHTGDTVVY